MQAFHNKTTEKRAILKTLRVHAKLDEIEKGHYWENGKGCAVGCTIHGSDHSLYEPRFGIPQMLARLEDAIFEGLPNDKAKQWPIEFMSAISPGADLSLVGWQFLHWLLTDEKVNPGINHPLVCDAVKKCADVLAPMAKGEKVDISAATSAAESATFAAWSATESAWSATSTTESAAISAAISAAWSAARSATESAASSAAWSASSAASSAARSAAWSATSAARSATESAAISAAISAASSAARSATSAARSATESAAISAAISAARSAAISAATSAAYELMRKKLLSLLSSATGGTK